MAGITTIQTRYIKGTGRRRGPVSVQRNNFSELDAGPGNQNLKHPVFNWKQEIVVSMTDGTKKSYDLRFTPIYPATLSVYINGLLQRQGIDYTLNDKTITFNQIIPIGFNIIAKYNAMEME